MKYVRKKRSVVPAAHMTIKRRLPWSLRTALAAVFVALIAAIAFWAYNSGRDLSGFNPAAAKEQLATLTQQVHRLTAERDDLRAAANAVESTMSIERAAQQQLAVQLKTLTAENTKLKQDLAFFESMLPTGSEPQDVAIQQLQAELSAPGNLHYRLLVRQGVRDRSFSGTLQLVLTVQRAGVSSVLLFPEPSTTGADQYKLEFKYYQRVEGTVTVPDGVIVKSVQARVLEKGKLRVQQSVDMRG